MRSPRRTHSGKHTDPRAIAENTRASPRGVSMNAIATRRCETRNSRPKLTALLAAAALMAAAGTARAQTFRGAIVGTVIDQSQAPVPGAQVTVNNQATGLA